MLLGGITSCIWVSAPAPHPAGLGARMGWNPKVRMQFGACQKAGADKACWALGVPLYTHSGKEKVQLSEEKAVSSPGTALLPLPCVGSRALGSPFLFRLKTNTLLSAFLYQLLSALSLFSGVTHGSIMHSLHMNRHTRLCCC